MKRKILEMVLALCALMAFVPYASAATVASGEAGYNAEWVFADDGTLTISGSGNMYNSQVGDTYACQVEEVIIKNGITGIGENSFYEYWYYERRYENAKKVEIPESVKSIGKYAFRSWTSLRTLNLPPSITSIGNEAFRDCNKLTNLKIPEAVSLICSGTCQGCNSLRTIYLPAGITEIEENAFDGCDKLTDVFFAGSADEWNNITIGKGNTYLTGATIHYNNAEGEYPYEISSVTLRSNSGEYINAVPDNESCIVNIAVTERLSRAERDYVFVALYDEAEQLVGTNYIRADFSAAHGCEFGLNIPKQTQKIGKIKAFIWSGFEDMTPLCEAKELSLK